MQIFDGQTLDLTTGNQLEFMCSCSLNCPLKEAITERRLNAQMADPPIELTGVLNTP